MIQIGKLQVIFDHHFNANQERVVKTILFNRHGKFLSQGQSTFEKKDNFSKDTGRRKALKVAFKKTNDLNKKQRTAFWDAYRTEMTKEPRW